MGNGVYVEKGTTDGYLTFTVPIDENDTETLVAGRTYEFVVSAINNVGESLQSDALEVIAATKPA